MECKHFSHNHGLVFHQLQPGSQVQCSGCKTPGSGNVYACWQCSYYLHEQCYRATRSLRNPSHPIHPLTLMPYPTYPSNTFFCNSCHLVGNGFSYCCAECDFDLHIHCATNNPYPTPNMSHHSNPTTTTPFYPPIQNNHFPHYNPTSDHIPNFSHPQSTATFPPPPPIQNNPTFPTYPNPNPILAHDIGTQQNPMHHPPAQFGPPPAYPQPSGTPPLPTTTTPSPTPIYTPPLTTITVTPPPPPPQTTYVPPPSTTTTTTAAATLPSQPNPPTLIKHFSHPHVLQPMELAKNNAKVCSACECELSGSAYCCTEAGCTFNLHKACFDSPQEVRHKSHLDHPLTLLTSPPYSDGFTCNACLKDGKAFTYHCSTCSYDLHIDCITWPEAVTRHDHKHDLKLYYSSPAPQNQNQNEKEVVFLCDVCKNPVHDMAWLYYCRECDYGTHLECVASGLQPNVTVSAGGQTDEELLRETELKFAVLQLLLSGGLAK